MTRDELVRALAGVPGPLAGLLVLELCGDEPSGTFGTQILADLGASVLKIERPPAGDPPPSPEPAEGEAVRRDIAYFFGLNRNKRSLCLDLKAPEGVAVFRDLAALADVFYDNQKPGVTRRLGIDPESLAAVNRALICCSVSGFGHSGPWSELPAYDATVQALGGGMSLTGDGEPESPPVRWGNPIGGIGGALYAVIGILAAVRRRRVAGAAARLDIALLDTQLAMHAYRVPSVFMGMQFEAKPRRGGSGALPYGPFLASDGRWFALGITGQFWQTACQVLGHPEWAEDARFATERERQANEEELNRLVAAAIAQRPSDQWQELFVAARIPGAKVNGIAEAFDHPHVALRDMKVGFDHPVGRHLAVAGNPIKLSAHRFAGFSPAPALGDDTRQVLESLLHRTPAEAERLRQAGAVWWSETGKVYERPSVV